MRARDLGIVIGRHATGRHNAITDVAGIRVGHHTIVSDSVRDDGRSRTARTGVTVIVPHENIWNEPVFAGTHRLNGSGEMTGLEWIRESGELTSPIGLTNTHSVGVVRDALVRAQTRVRGEGTYWCLPVVGETYDGVLNDINAHHVRPEHVEAALQSAASGPVGEGNVGGGTGMICHDFKGGIGTSSRIMSAKDTEYTVGVLVQANYGRRGRLRINGIPVGERIGPDVVPLPSPPGPRTSGSGSIIIVVATDAPLLPHQCTRMAQRASLAVGRMGGTGEQYSGDIFLGFSTGNRGLPTYSAEPVTDDRPSAIPVRMLAPHLQTLLFDLTIEATEEAIVNSMVAARTMTGHRGATAHAIDHRLLRDAVLP